VFVVITAPNASVMANRDAMNVFSIVVPHEWHSLKLPAARSHVFVRRAASAVVALHLTKIHMNAA